MNSITKSAPLFNIEKGIISYSWDDLMLEHPLCPHCGKSMTYWYSRKRGVIISDCKYTFMAPRFKCDCGHTLTMRPYFIPERKQYSIFSIEDILVSDVSSDRTVATSYGSSQIARLRKWAVALVKKLAGNSLIDFLSDERTIIRKLYQLHGLNWLSTLLQKENQCISFILPGT